MANTNLNNAQAANQDEFYTQYADIEREVLSYVEYNADVFRGKTILLPCDDPEWSNFTKFFARRFEEFGIKKLISTSYAPDSKKLKNGYQPSLFETDAPQFDPQKTQTHGKIFVLERDVTGDGVINDDDLEWDYLEGDGDFRSVEVTKLRDESDIIITNPPFSLFNVYFHWLIESGKQFLYICNKNCISTKEVFPYVKDNKVWIGTTRSSLDLLFDVPNETAEYYLKNEKEGSKYRIINGKVMGRSPSIWMTNIEHGQRHQPLELMTMADNLKFCTHKDLEGLVSYMHYDNFNAIEVPATKSIPSDYNGMMGVPISFLGFYCPEQFEIVGITKTWFGAAEKTYPKQKQVNKNGTIGKKEVTKLNDGAVIEIPGPLEGDTYYIVDGKYYMQKFVRILIRKKQ